MKHLIKWDHLPNGVWMIDGEVEHLLHPNTFMVPNTDIKRTLQVGHFVKVGVKWRIKKQEQIDGERFWLKIIHKLKCGDLTGEIRNELLYGGQHRMCLDMRLRFQLRHILDTNIYKL